MKTVLIIFTAVILSGCSNKMVVPAPVVSDHTSYSSHPENDRYLRQLQDYRTKTNAPGAILAVKKEHAPIWIGATGQSNLEYNTPMVTSTQFRTGSITKIFTAIVMLRLAELNIISLEDPLSKHLPETEQKIPDAEKITVRHLLAHLSGIVDPPNENLQYQADILNDPVTMQAMSVDKKLEKYVYGKKLHFVPGTNYSYSNTNYWLLGKIAAKASSKNLQTLMLEYIFSPLGMKDTYLESRDDRNVARGYANLYNDNKLFDVTVWDRAEGDGEADGGIISTAPDLHLFLEGLFGHKLISRQTLEDMKTIQLKNCDNPNCEYGLGLEIWRTDAGKAYGHNGGLVGIEANILFYEETGAISVLYKNNGSGSDKRFLDELIKN